MSVRPGFSVLGGSFGGALGLGVWKEQELHGVFADGTWRKWTGAAWSAPLKSGLNTGAAASFTNFKGGLPEISLFMANGKEPLMYYDGNAVTTVPGAPAGINFIESHVERLWGAVGNTLYCSSYRLASDWTTVNQDEADPFYTEVETPNGETIDGVIASSNSLIVTKKSSIHKLFGYSSSDFSLRRVTREVGFINNTAATIIKDVMYLLDDRGIHDYYGSTRPENAFSAPVQDYIDRMNRTARGKSCVGTDGKNLYAAIPVNSAAAPDTILVYDFLAKSWDVWEGMSPTCFAKLGDELYIGDSLGRVLKLGGTTDNGVPISWFRESIPYTAASLSQRTQLQQMWAAVELAAGSTLDIYLSPSTSGEDWTRVKSFTAAGYTAVPIMIPVNLVANTAAYRIKLAGTGPCTVKEIAREQIDMPIR